MEIKAKYKIQYDCPNSEIYLGASLAVQWLGLYSLTVKGSGFSYFTTVKNTFMYITYFSSSDGFFIHSVNKYVLILLCVCQSLFMHWGH